MWSVVGCVSRGSGWGERVKFIGFSKLIEAHEGLYLAISLTRVSPSLSLASLGLGSRGPTPRGAGSRLVFSLSALASRFSRLASTSVYRRFTPRS